VLTLNAPVTAKMEDDEWTKYLAENRVEDIKDAGGQKLKGAEGIGPNLFFGPENALAWGQTPSWLTIQTQKPVILKEVRTHGDAYLANLWPQVKCIALSHHDARAMDTAPPAVHTLPGIQKYCLQVFEKFEVIIDGGVQRGTDAMKALAFRAKEVGVARAALFGQGTAGVGRVLQILNSETATAMRLFGVER